MTKFEIFNELRTLALGNDDLVNFIDKEIASLNKKRAYVSPKDKAKAEMDIALREKILSILTKDGMLTSDIAKATTDGISTSKTTSLLKVLVEDGKVKREVIKSKSYYSLAD